jgi:hypothetical protein
LRLFRFTLLEIGNWITPIKAPAASSKQSFSISQTRSVKHANDGTRPRPSGKPSSTSSPTMQASTSPILRRVSSTTLPKARNPCVRLRIE